MNYRCGHPRTLGNSKADGYHPSGKPRFKCRICRRVIEARSKKKYRANLIKGVDASSPPL